MCDAIRNGGTVWKTIASSLISIVATWAIMYLALISGKAENTDVVENRARIEFVYEAFRDYQTRMSSSLSRIETKVDILIKERDNAR